MNIKKLIFMTAVATGIVATSAMAVSAASIPTAGTGTVIDDTTTSDSSQREFLTVKSADGTVFYIVVDKEKTGDNVYMLTPVTEASLKSLAEQAASQGGTGTTSAASGSNGFSNLFGGTSSSAGTSSTSSGTANGQAGTAGVNKNSSKEKSTAAANSSNTNLIIIGVVLALVFAAGYYFKIYKPKHSRKIEEDEGDYQDEYEEEYETEDVESEEESTDKGHADSVPDDEEKDPKSSDSMWKAPKQPHDEDEE